MISQIYINAIPVIVVLITLIGTYYMFVKPINALYIILYTFPFENFYIYFGTNFEIWKLLSLMFLIFKLPLWLLKNRFNFKENIYLKIIIIFIYYVFIVTLVNLMFLVNKDVSLMQGGFLKNEGRFIPQLLFFLITINLIFIPFFIIKSFQEIINCLRILLFSCFLLSFFGVLQFLLVKSTGVNPFPIQDSGGGTYSGYVFKSIFRINSIAGEPKHMAIAMVIGITIIVLARVKKIKLIKYDIPLLLTMIFNLFFTYSTTGYVLLVVSITLSFILNGLFNFKSFLLGSIILLFGVAIFSNISDSELKSFNKQKDKAGFEDQDQTIIDYFSDEPMHAITGTGLGNIHYYSVKYFPKNFPLFKDTPYKANSGILFMISDYGIIGVCCVFWVLYNLYKRNIKLLKKNDVFDHREILLLNYFAIIISFLFLLRYTEIFFIFIGIMVKLNDLLNKTSITKIIR